MNILAAKNFSQKLESEQNQTFNPPTAFTIANLLLGQLTLSISSENC